MTLTESKGTNMNIRRLISIGLLVSSICLQSAIAAPSINGISLDIYQTHWHAVKDIFVTQPQETAGQSNWPIIPALAAAGVAGWLTWKKLDSALGIVNRNVWPLSYDAYIPMEIEFKGGGSLNLGEKHLATIKHKVGSPLLTVLATAGATVAGWKLVNWLSRSPSRKAAERKQMEQIMDSWKQVRSYFPEELHAAFDALYKLRIEQSPAYTANVDKTIHFAQDSVRRHFSKPLLSYVFQTINKMEVHSAH